MKIVSSLSLRSVKIQETRSWGRTINMLQTGGLVDGIPSCGKKILVIKAYWNFCGHPYTYIVSRRNGSIPPVCFNKHFRKRVLTIMDARSELESHGEL